MNNAKLVEALKRIAAYPETRATELGYEGCRKIARQALAEHEEHFAAQVTGPDEYGSVYVYFQPNARGAVGRTHGKAPVTVNVDYDHEGNLYGIELIGVNAPPLPTPPKVGE
jgi:hypothetical protein